MSCSRIFLVVVCLIIASAVTARAQQTKRWADEQPEPPTLTKEHFLGWEETSPNVWHLMRYAGVLKQEAGLPRPTVAGATFALYEEKEGGVPLWMETQNVQVDQQGHYSALLGATQTGGVPAELFTSGKARWLGIRVVGQFEEERVPLGSVPYAVQAGDAQTLGGKSAADYALAEQIRQQVQEEVRRELQAAGFDVSKGDPAGNRFQKQGITVASGPPAVPERPPTLADLDAKLNTILAILNEPETVFSFVLCTEPALSYGGRFKGEFELKGAGEGRLGAEAFGNGAMVKADAEGKITSEQELALNWDILKLGVCVDLGAAVRNASPTTSSGGATPLRQASLTANVGIAANGGGLLDHIANLDQDKMLDDMLGLADTLAINPATLQNAFDPIAGLSFNTSGGPFAALQLKDADRNALIAALPIPAGVRPVVEDPAGFLRGQVQSLLTQLTQPRGICNISPPLGLEPFLAQVCNQPPEPYGLLLTGLKTTTNAIDDTVGDIKTNVGTVSAKVTGVGTALNDLFCQTFPITCP